MKEEFRREKVSDDEWKELLTKLDYPEALAESREVYLGYLYRYISNEAKTSKTRELTEEFASYGRMYSF